MKIFEVLKFVADIDRALVNEGFRELAARNKFKNASEDEKTNAREVYQELIKNASIKNEFIKGKTGNIDQMIEKTYSSLAEFINGINGIKTAVEERAKQKKAAKDTAFRQKAMANAGKNISKDAAKYAQYLAGNWYVIPCHIYEEVRDAAKALTGNLPTGFADSYIEGKWVIDIPTASVIEAEPNGIDVNNLNTLWYEKIKKPRPGEQAKTSLNPTEYLNVYRTAPFFMQPSWCIAGSEKR